MVRYAIASSDLPNTARNPLSRRSIYCIALLSLLLPCTTVRADTKENIGKLSSSAKSATSIEEAKQLFTQAGFPVRDYFTYDFGREQDKTGISVLVEKESTKEMLTALRSHLKPGLHAFIGTSNWLGKERNKGVEVAVISGPSQFAILEKARTDGINYELETNKIVEKLRDFDKRFGITILQAETDSIQFTLQKLPPDVKKFAEEIYEFCPDSVDQGAGSIETLGQNISKDKSVSLWWD